MKKPNNALRGVTKLFLGALLFSWMSLLSAAMLDEDFQAIKNFHFVSPQLASSGRIELDDYTHITDYGFKHVINLIPGMQIKERKRVESVGLTYEQIPVVWKEPQLADFQRFVALMKSYGEDKVYVHCELNWRASTFVYLYRVTQLGVSETEAKKDLLQIWEPEPHWQSFIDNILQAYQS